MTERAIQRMEWMARAAEAEAKDPEILRGEFLDAAGKPVVAYRLGVAEAAEDFRLAAHALRCRGPLVEALDEVMKTAEGLEEFYDGAEGTNARMMAGPALALAKETP